MRILATQIVDMQGYQGVVAEALKEFVEQIHIEGTHCAFDKLHVIFQTGAPGKIDHDSRERLIQWHIGVAITTNAGLVQRLVNSLAQCNTDVFHGVVGIDLQIANCLDT